MVLLRLVYCASKLAKSFFCARGILRLHLANCFGELVKTLSVTMLSEYCRECEIAPCKPPGHFAPTSHSMPLACKGTEFVYTGRPVSGSLVCSIRSSMRFSNPAPDTV